MRSTLLRWFILFTVLALSSSCSDADAGNPNTTSTQAAENTSPATASIPETTATDSPVTIMHVGEGLTQGDRNDSTYRCFLDAMLRDAGIAFDFVGSRQKPADGYDYTCPTDFDQDHEAWVGAPLGGFETEMMTASVEALQPDVALVHLGSEEVWNTGDPDGTAEKLKSFITGLQAASPDITILVASMIPCVTPLPWCTDAYPALNDAIASFGNLSTEKSTVMSVDMRTGMSTDLLRSNNLSFTDAGDEMMASRWMAALEESGVISTGG